MLNLLNYLKMVIPWNKPLVNLSLSIPTTDSVEIDDDSFVFIYNSPLQLNTYNYESGFYKGYAVIFNHQKYKKNLNLKERFGTENDVKAIKESFDLFNIFVDVKQDLTLKEIEAEVVRLRNMDFTKCKCFLIVILTHGEKENVLWARDWKYNFLEKIINPIVHTNDSVDKIPKLFITQACKGINNPITFNQKGNIGNNSPIIMPNVLDMILIFSTYEGHISTRDIRTGGIFIQMFCKKIKEFGNTESITNIMERVTNQLFLNNEQQVPTVISTLTEPFFFGNIKQQKKGYVLIYYNKKFSSDYKLDLLINTFKIFNTIVEIKDTDDNILDESETKRLENFDFTPFDYFIILNFCYLYQNITIYIVNSKSNKSLEGIPKIIINSKLFNHFEEKIISNLMTTTTEYPDLLLISLTNKYKTDTFQSYHEYNKLFILLLAETIIKYGSTKSFDIIINCVKDRFIRIDELSNLPVITHSTLKEPFYFDDNNRINESIFYDSSFEE